MHASDVFDILGGILILAVVAVVLTKQNTAADVNAAGGQFTGAIKAAEAG